MKLNRLCRLVAIGIAASATVIVSLWTSPIVAQEIHANLCLHGCPSGSPATNDLVIRDIYILSSNDRAKFADWVAYRVTQSTIGKSKGRTWRPDPWLADDETLEPSDYAGANDALQTDRGHQAPLASFSGADNWAATNYLSNITPQKGGLNQSSWSMLEDAVRDLAEKQEIDAVYVMTGPLYERNMPPLPGADESHIVPSGYWKIIATQGDDDIKIAAFLFDQETERRADYCADSFVTSVRNIERKTGLNFFHALPWTTQDDLENGPATLLTDLGCEP